MPFTAAEIASQLQGEVLGDAATILTGFAPADGARPGDLQALLSAAGIPTDDIGPIRIRDRMTFIGVRKAALDRVVTALSGQVIGGRTVIAELARGR